MSNPLSSAPGPKRSKVQNENALTKRDSVLSAGSLGPSRAGRGSTCAHQIVHQEPSNPLEATVPTKLWLDFSACEDTTCHADIPRSVIIPKRACACLDCAPHFYAETTHANELADFPRLFSQLRLFQHDCLQLVDLAIQSFHPRFLRRHQGPQSIVDRRRFERLEFLSFSQRHAMQNWKDWRWHWNTRRHFPGMKLRDKYAWIILHKPVEMLNQLFFLGQLPTTASGDLEIIWQAPGTGQRASSFTIPDGKSTIWLNPDHACHFLDPRGLMNTLLHELCHVFLQRHSCYAGGGEGCDGNQMCVELCQENFGFTSHGRAWQMLAAAIEEAAPKLLGSKLLGRPWKVDLGRDECAAREIVAGGGRGWWPSACDFESFGGDLEWELQPLLRSRECEDAVTLRKVRSWVMRNRMCRRNRTRRNSI